MIHSVDEDSKSHDHSEVLNGKRPDADARLVNDILNYQDSIDESDPDSQNAEIHITANLNKRASAGIPTSSSSPDDCRARCMPDRH